MARPKKATVDYFPHYTASGKTLYALENKFGNDGYAFWFKTLEILGSTEQHFIDCRDFGTWEFLQAKTRLSEEVVLKILELLSKLGAIDAELWSKKIIWSEKFIENLGEAYARREISPYTKSDIMSLCIQKPQSTDKNADINPQMKVNEMKLDEKIKDIPDKKKPKTKKVKKFIKPTLDQVKEYLKEINSTIDAEKWYDYYESNGWKVSKNSMKDWKACCRNWSRNENRTPSSRGQQNVKQLNNFKQRDYEEEDFSQYYSNIGKVQKGAIE